jgi:raffinose synthase
MKTMYLMIISVMVISCTSHRNDYSIKVKREGDKLNLFFGGAERMTGGMLRMEGSMSEKNLIVATVSDYAVGFKNEKDEYHLEIINVNDSNIIGFYIDSLNKDMHNGHEYMGLFFESIPGYKQGVQIWRYKPWNSWTKPIKTASPSDLMEWDVQFFYWQYTDGTYGAAVPLSGNGFRTTLGTSGELFGAKALTYTNAPLLGKVPLMALGFGDDPYILFEELYSTSLKMMGKEENLRVNKEYPEIMDYMGWCSWNSSGNGNNLNEQLLVDAASSFYSNNFPLKWMIIDDGWSQNTNRQLDCYLPIEEKFPNGFKPVIETLKKDFGIKYIGAWHAFNGYWSGINKDSEMGEAFKNVLFPYTDYNPMIANDPGRECNMINPYTDSLLLFYDTWHQWMVDQGVDFVKVDNQLSVERMAKDNFPIWDVADKMHQALYTSIDKHFNSVVINCMNMTNDAFYNFGTSAIARTVEDYFPFKENETYNLQEGNAAAHVTQALYNSSYFQQMVWPDYDMFESHNPNAAFHAIARAISGGPVYVTDIPGKQNFDVLHPLVYADGKIIRADVPARLTIDCLFQVQDFAPLKAFSFANGAGLLGIWNAADTSVVEGTFKVSDIQGIEGDTFAIYEHFSKKIIVANLHEEIDVVLNRMEYRYYNVVPIRNDMAIIGLTNKYNAPKTIKSLQYNENAATVTLNEGGNFIAYLENTPKKVILDGSEMANYTFDQNTFQIHIANDVAGSKTLDIFW